MPCFIHCLLLSEASWYAQSCHALFEVLCVFKWLHSNIAKLEQDLVLKIIISVILFQALFKMINKIIRKKVDKNDGRVLTQSHKQFFGLTYAKSI